MFHLFMQAEEKKVSSCDCTLVISIEPIFVKGKNTPFGLYSVNYCFQTLFSVGCSDLIGIRENTL